MDKKTLKDIDVKGKKVLVRVDFNVPLKNGEVLDDTRIKAALPTIKFLVDNSAKVILVTHLGRPKGKVVPEMSVKPLVQHLSILLGKEVYFAGDCGGEESKSVIDQLETGQVALLENVRFYAGEEKNDPEMSKALASLADIYVNDAFGTAHRAHSSTEGVARLLPAVAGFLMEKEIYALSHALNQTEKPFMAILGGAKISDKILVMENLINKVDSILVGGGMANTFLKAKGYEMGKSLVEEDKIDIAQDILEKADKAGVKVLLPIDVVIADEFSASADKKTVSVDNIPKDWMVMDIGTHTKDLFVNAIKEAKTVIWNGPLGVYEFDSFAVGTNELAIYLANSQAKTIIGGGDVVAAVEKTGTADKMFHISTGGGASLKFLEGKPLPGVVVLEDL